MIAVQFYDVVLWVHIMAVVVSFGALFTYPLWFGLLRSSEPAQRVLFHRAQAAIARFVVSPGLLVIIAAGAYLASDRHFWSKAWVSVPLVIAVVLGGAAGAFFSPREERLAALAATGGGPHYDRLLAQVRTVSYLAMLLVLVAAFFMVTKLGG